MENRKQPLVSMITYCFNGEGFLDAYFQALLAQTYSNIELFFYNNGSADRTGEIAESYRKQLEEKGLAVHMEHYETNQATTSLKEKAMLQLKGKYFFGVDSDDIMTPDHVEVMVGYLERNPKTDLVFGKLISILEATGDQLGVMKMTQKPSKELFVDCLFSRNMIYTPIGYLVRTEAFRRANKGMNIYHTRHGENYQILLPLLYFCEAHVLDCVVGKYLVRRDSYTGKLRDPRKKIEALDAQIDTIAKTLERMQIPDEEKYQRLAERRLLRDSLTVSFMTGDRAFAKERLNRLRSQGGAGLMDYLRYIRFRIKG